MRRFEKADETLGLPMIATGLTEFVIHSLLNNAPVTVFGGDEGMQVQVKAVLDRGAVNFRHESAGPHQRGGINAGHITDTHQLLWGPARVRALAAAYINPELVLYRSDSAF